jgi:hypothetical protein
VRARSWPAATPPSDLDLLHEPFIMTFREDDDDAGQGTKLLAAHGSALLSEAREVLAGDPAIRVAGVIVLPGSSHAPAFRELLQMVARGARPGEPLVGLVPRAILEDSLGARFGNQPWQEQGWRKQRVLPVVVFLRHTQEFAFLAMEQPGPRHP